MTDRSEKIRVVSEKLKQSPFRAKFSLGEKEQNYVKEKGMAVIRGHAEDFIEKRLSPAVIANDGKQTPMRGHPVFIAQHATATCCRGCLQKWHRIPEGRNLTQEEKTYIVDLLMAWIEEKTSDD